MCLINAALFSTDCVIFICYNVVSNDKDDCSWFEDIDIYHTCNGDMFIVSETSRYPFLTVC